MLYLAEQWAIHWEVKKRPGTNSFKERRLPVSAVSFSCTADTNSWSAKFLKIHLEMVWVDLWQLLQLKTLMVRHGGSSAGSYLADPTSPIPSHGAVIVLFKSVPVHQLLWLALKELKQELPADDKAHQVIKMHQQGRDQTQGGALVLLYECHKDQWKSCWVITAAKSQNGEMLMPSNFMSE